MTEPWWTRDRAAGAQASLIGTAPVLRSGRQGPSRRGDVVRALLTRAAAYTPDWTQRRDGDAGYALARLFSEMAEPLLNRLNRLPEKAFIEFLRTAGISTMAAIPAQVMVAITVDPAAPGSVLIAEGTQLTVDAADGSGDTVVFETERTLFAAPLSIAAVFRRTGGLYEQMDLTPGAAAWQPFGLRPRPGAELMIGLAGVNAPRGSLALAIDLAVQDGAPPPVASGTSAAARPVPLLTWAVIDGASPEPVSVLRDDSQSLTQSGIIEIRLPQRWRRGKPAAIDLPDALFWLQLRLQHGEFAAPPAIQALHLNAVNAVAIETVRDEVLDFVPGSNRQKARLSRSPVLADTLQLAVIEPGVDGDSEVVWTRTEALARHGGDERVYQLDAASGEVTFGDNIHGQRPPLGFRNIIARRYATGGGLGGRVAADAGFRLARTLPFVSGVANPQAGSGGRAAETFAETSVRGPLEIRTGGRAVALADYELLALRAPGADVARACAIASHDARYPGATMPGSVTVLVVSTDRGADLPLADAGTLAAVSAWLNRTVAPAGIQIVAACPPFERVGVRASVLVATGADSGQVVAAALANLQDFLHPLRGGADRTGWPFGATIRHQALTRMLIDRTPGLVAVEALNLVVDGVPRGSCRDWAIAPHALIWPEGHEIVPLGAGDAA